MSSRSDAASRHLLCNCLPANGWRDCPADYGPSTTIYNRFNRWSRKRFWADLVEALALSGAVTKSTAIDTTYIKAHRSAHGGKAFSMIASNHLPGSRRRKITLSDPRAAAKQLKSMSSRT